jgi:hypothetical protein
VARWPNADHDDVASEVRPRTDPEVARFLDALGRDVLKLGGRARSHDRRIMRRPPSLRAAVCQRFYWRWPAQKWLRPTGLPANDGGDGVTTVLG